MRSHRKENLRNAVASIFIQLVEISVRPPWPSLYLELHQHGCSYSKVGGKVGEKVIAKAERKRKRERGRRVAGRALNNRFNWVMHEEVTYAKGLNLAARDLLLAALPTLRPFSLSPLFFSSLCLLFRSIYPNDARGNLFGPNSGSQLSRFPLYLRGLRCLSKDLTKRIVRSVRRN